MTKYINTFLVSLLTCFICIYIYDKSIDKRIVEQSRNYATLVSQVETNSSPSEINMLHSGKLENFVSAAAKATNCVVNIEAIQKKKNFNANTSLVKSNGSGVILSSDGYIVTNYHVIENADDIEIKLEDNREFKADVIGYDVSTDLGLIKIDASNLVSLEFGDSDSLEVGEWVLAVGNPFKLSASVTAGIVSAKARNINIFSKQGVESFIQTDAAINPGNSGGALIDAQGKLMGINTAILTYSGKYEGFSFAIPSTVVSKIVKDLKEYGAVQRAWLGLSILPINERRADKLKLTKISGVFVDMVEKDGGAEDAGIKYQDVIVSIDDISTGTKPIFQEVLSRYRPGDTIRVGYIRKGKLEYTEAVLRNQLNTTDYIAVRRDQVFTELGFELRDLDEQEKSINHTEGIMVVSIKKGSLISSINMDPGYIITSLNDKKITSVSQFKTELENTKGTILLNGIYENYPNEWPYKFIVNE